jgi:hypothetical protein
MSWALPVRKINKEAGPLNNSMPQPYIPFADSFRVSANLGFRYAEKISATESAEES